MEEDRELLRMWFESVDEDNSNSINAQELQRALEVGNLKFSKSIVAQMIRMYDVDQNGAMSFEDPLADCFMNLINKVDYCALEFVSLHKFLNVVQSSFAAIAREQQVLSLNEVYAALQQAGYMLDQPSFYTACQSFDPNRTGNFKLDDFISMCIFLQSARNLFNAFDTSKQGRISLDFNQFIYCAANMRI